MKFKYYISIFLLILCLCNEGYSVSWTLANAVTTTGASAIITHDTFHFGKKSLVFITSGTVNMSVNIFEDSSLVPIKTLTFTTAGKWKYTTDHTFDSFKITYTITTGTLTVLLKCY
jgi:hypothetical protein